METVILWIIAVGILLDAVSNLFLIKYYPKWEQYKRKEIMELRKQNKELQEFVSGFIQQYVNYGEEDETVE